MEAELGLRSQTLFMVWVMPQHQVWPAWSWDLLSSSQKMGGRERLLLDLERGEGRTGEFEKKMWPSWGFFLLLFFFFILF